MAKFDDRCRARLGEVVMSDAPRARDLTQLIKSGAVNELRKALASDPTLALVRVDDGMAIRSTLHLATDWPGGVENVSEIIAQLVAAGCDPNVRAVGPHGEGPLHWAASTNDLDAIDALVDAGADLELDGAVIGGGTALADAVAFGHWEAAARLLEHGAKVNLWQAAALGMEDVVASAAACASELEITNAFWSACHGGQRGTAELLLRRGADPGWVGHDGRTPRDQAARNGHDELVAWLDAVSAERSV